MREGLRLRLAHEATGSVKVEGPQGQAPSGAGVVSSRLGPVWGPPFQGPPPLGILGSEWTGLQSWLSVSPAATEMCLPGTCSSFLPAQQKAFPPTCQHHLPAIHTPSLPPSLHLLLPWVAGGPRAEVLRLLCAGWLGTVSRVPARGVEASLMGY